MKLEIDTESDEFRKMIEKNVVESDLVQDEIQKVLDTDEMQEALKKKVRAIISSKEMNDIIVERVNRYVTNEYDMEDDDKIKDIITNRVKDFIKTKFSIQNE